MYLFIHFYTFLCSFKEIFKNILEKCHNKIKHTANTHIGQQYVYFTVPRILVGYPIFDREKCSLYIVKKLVENS